MPPQQLSVVREDADPRPLPWGLQLSSCGPQFPVLRTASWVLPLTVGAWVELESPTPGFSSPLPIILHENMHNRSSLEKAL